MSRVCKSCGYMLAGNDVDHSEECPKCGGVFGETVSSLLGSSSASTQSGSQPQETDPTVQTSSFASKFVTITKLNSSKRIRTKALAFSVTLSLILALCFYTFLWPTTLEGEVFVTTNYGPSIQLGSVRIDIYPADEVRNLTLKERSKASKELEELSQASSKYDLDHPDYYKNLARLYDRYGDYYSSRNASNYIRKLKIDPIASRLTDSNGRFAIKLPRGQYFLTTVATRDVITHRERYQWGLFVNTSNNEKTLLSSMNQIDSECKECLESLFSWNFVDQERKHLELLMAAHKEKQLDAINSVVTILRDAAVKKAVETRRIEEIERNEKQIREQEISERRAALLSQIDSLNKQIPEFDLIKIKLPECADDNMSMPQLLACGRARRSAEVAHEKKTLPLRLKIQELQRELINLAN